MTDLGIKKPNKYWYAITLTNQPTHKPNLI